MKWTQQNVLNPHLRASTPKYSPTSLEDWKNSRVRLTDIVILTKFSSISRNLADIFQSWDPELTPDHLGLKWTWQGKIFWTLTFELLGRNIAPLHFKTERLAKTVLRPWWFWLTSAKFPGIWGIFYTPWGSILTRDGLGLQWNWHTKTF